MALRNKQLIFISEYLKDFNARQAAIRAGYSEKTAGIIGHENLNKPYIAEEIKRQIDERIMSADEVKTRLADIARGDLADFMDFTTSGYVINMVTKDEYGNLIPKTQTKLIKKIKQKVTTYLSKSEDGEDREIIETELELYSAHDALRDIGKIHALFTDKTDVNTHDETIVIDIIDD